MGYWINKKINPKPEAIAHLDNSKYITCVRQKKKKHNGEWIHEDVLPATVMISENSITVRLCRNCFRQQQGQQPNIII